MQNQSSIPPWLAAEVAAYDLDLVPPPNTILDIGANIGAFSLHYVRKWPAAQILAFEPVPANFEQLLRNTAHFRNISPTNAAVRNFSGRADIFLGDVGVTCSFHQRGRQTSLTVPVDCSNVRQIPSCELVKIDTEGCEVEILRGLDFGSVRALVCEYHAAADIPEIKELCWNGGLLLLESIPASAEHGVLKFARPNTGVSLPVNQDSVESKSKIFVALPINREVTAPTAMALLRLAARGITGTVRFNNGDGVSRSRNRLTADFLAGDWTHLLFIDSDIDFTVADFDRITSHDVPVVGGLYPLRSPDELEWCANGLVPPPPIRPDGLQAVKYIGTGFLCIARDVFVRMIGELGEQIEYTSDLGARRTEWDFFPHGVYEYRDGSKRYLSEDWYFCQRWLDLGGEVFADTHVLLQHVGQASYPLPHQQKQFLADQQPHAR